MKSILVLLLIISIAFTANLRDRVQYEYSFQNYIRENSKTYSTAEEYIYRLQIFADNMDKIEIHNSAPSLYKLGINKFSDLTNKEFENSKFCGGLLLNNNKSKNLKENIYKIKNKNVPEEVDWTKNGAVSEVKDQGACGSCWAFSATGSLESVYYLKNKEMKLFSEQELVDCSTGYGNDGCNGGLMTNAFDYVMYRGLCLEDDYPYHGIDENCKISCEASIHIQAYVKLPQYEIALEECVSDNPISVALNASPIQSYSKGIFDGPCSASLNHGVLAVGYGIENGIKYWKLKNSWGEKWGENGYFRIIKDIEDKSGQCGIALMNSFPII